MSERRGRRDYGNSARQRVLDLSNMIDETHLSEDQSSKYGLEDDEPQDHKPSKLKHENGKKKEEKRMTREEANRKWAESYREDAPEGVSTAETAASHTSDGVKPNLDTTTTQESGTGSTKKSAKRKSVQFSV